MPKAKIVAPMPKAGDFVIVAHELVDPHYWWVSQVEWAEADQLLVRDTKGWFPSHEPCLLTPSRSVLAFGTQSDCRKLVAQARSIKLQHEAAIRDANVALAAAQDAAREAIRAIVTEGNRRLHGDVTVIEP